MRFPFILSLTLVLHAGLTELGFAATRVVPDDDATIQAALDSQADTVLVRDGVYPERILVSHPYLDQVLCSHPDNSGTPRIAGLEIVHRAHYFIIGLHFESRVRLGTTGDSEPLDFERCRFDSGLTHTLGDFSDLSPLTVRHCVVRGDIVALPSIAYFESDTLRGAGLDMHLEGAALHVTNCVFEGPGTAAIRAHSGTGSVFARGNTIRGYARGVVLDMEDLHGGEIAGNTIADCSEWGIAESADGQMDIVRNTIRRCGGGIQVDSDDAYGSVVGNDVRDCASGINVRGESFTMTLRGNRVLRVAGSGIVAEASHSSTILVEDNVVGRCGATGIVASSGPEESSVILRSNTSYANQGHGFGLNVYEGSTTPRLERNISVSNAGFGLMAADGIAALNCNDWFFNQSGATSGVSIGSEDYSVDPGFCDIDTDSVHLTSLSPLLAAPGCGRIGALGQGCETTTEVRVVTLQAARSPEGVEIRWRGAAAAVAVERAPAAAGPWVGLALAPVLGDGEWVALDREASPGQDHWYRLVIVGGGGATGAGPILVPAAAGTRAPGLRAIRPNPGAGPMTIEFVTAREEAVRLSVLDVQGREVALLAHGPRTAGAQLAIWNGEGARGPLQAGLYFIRLEIGGRVWTRRWVLAR